MEEADQEGRYSMSRYTPGPWHVKEEKGSYGIFAQDDSFLAITLPDDIKDRSAVRANAILMAAAPRLLEVMQEVKAHLDNNMIVTKEGYRISGHDLRQSITDALLKAEGHRL